MDHDHGVHLAELQEAGILWLHGLKSFIRLGWSGWCPYRLL